MTTMHEWSAATPIDTFEHPETGSIIDVVSMIHVGFPSYYQKLGGYIMGRQDEGFTVHYESIAESDESASGVGSVGRIKQRVHEACSDKVVDGLVLVEVGSRYTMQDASVLFREEGSENHDITEDDIVRHKSLFRQIREFGNARKLTRNLEKADSKGTKQLDEVVFGIIKKVVNQSMRGKSRNRRRDRVTIGMRNQVALEGVDGALEEDEAAKLVLVWGLGHLAGLQSGILERGYAHIERQEVVVAISDAIAEKSMQNSQRKVEKLQATLNKRQARFAPKGAYEYRFASPKTRYGKKGNALTQFEKEMEKSRKETQRWLDESQRRSEERMRKLDEDIKRRQRELWGPAIKDRNRRFSTWFRAN